ncbi:hypothetical protein [Mycobacterium terramassiliense]|uniref:Uncharacterized protein n=1 Tax=Mycobacterium terramassiliense TaxID=1841859 RepID=A0A2U3NK69_9MYCO|nr:hypothetical protein [Mycobacterium terramassiliense]SPM31937.1 hypothetical protein K875_00671 [Mycobacterium terramassiliense]
MDLTHAIAPVAVLVAIVAVGPVAPPASGAPEMMGHYVFTETKAGHNYVTDWNVNPCGEGCIDIKAGNGISRAQLVDGRWVLDMFDNVRCADGVRVPYAANAHIMWDPNTLAGTDQQVYTQAACGQPAGYTETNPIQLRATPP